MWIYRAGFWNPLLDTDDSVHSNSKINECIKINKLLPKISIRTLMTNKLFLGYPAKGIFALIF